MQILRGRLKGLYLGEELGLNETRVPQGKEVGEVVASASLSSLSSSSMRERGGSLRGGMGGRGT